MRMTASWLRAIASSLVRVHRRYRWPEGRCPELQRRDPVATPLVADSRGRTGHRALQTLPTTIVVWDRSAPPALVILVALGD